LLFYLVSIKVTTSQLGDVSEGLSAFTLSKQVTGYTKTYFFLTQYGETHILTAQVESLRIVGVRWRFKSG